MTQLFGTITLQDSQRGFVNTIGQEQIFTEAQRYLQLYNDSVMPAMAALVGGTTENHQERYRLPGGGRLQRRGGQTQSAATKAGGYWTVAYPLEDFGAQLAGDDVSLAYMTPEEMQLHFDNILLQDTDTMRFEALKRVFNNVATTFNDPIWGSLTVQPLANGDSVLFPPVLGSNTEATEDHYLASGYTAANINDTNIPFPTLRNELEHHFGTPTGFGMIAAMINSDETPQVEALTDFVPVSDNYIQQGMDADVPQGMPQLPGRILGRCNGVWVVEWRWIPSGYALAVDLMQSAPLKMRVDPSDTGLPSGLQLVATDEDYPLQQSHFRHRFGLGTSNRLNGVVMQFTTGSYTIPSIYQ